MNWLYLFLAIFFEIMGTTSVKLSNGFTKIVPSILMFVFLWIKFKFFILCLKKN